MGSLERRNETRDVRRKGMAPEYWFATTNR